MTFLPLDRPATDAPLTLSALVHSLRSFLPRSTPINGAVAERQNLLRAQARARVDRLLR